MRGLLLGIFTIALIFVMIWWVRYRKRDDFAVVKKNKVVESFAIDPITRQPRKILLCNRQTEECSFPQFSHPCCVSNGIEMLRDITDVFDRYNIPLWITYGTLLGHQRHGGFMPWDNDIDLMTLREHDTAIREAMKEISMTYGYDVKRETGKAANPTHPDYDYYAVYYSPFNRLHVDIALATKVGKVLFDGPPSDKDISAFKQWIHPYEDIFPLQRGEMYGLSVTIPYRPRRLLTGWYGGDCMKVAKVKMGDVPGTNDNLETKTITIFDPARPLQLVSRSPAENPYRIAKCYIVNMKERRDRLHHTVMQCERVGLRCQPIVAVEGRSLSIEDLEAQGMYAPVEDYKMKPNEIACALSHIKAIGEIAKQPSPRARYLVLEDDIVFLSDFEKVASEVASQLDELEWDVVFYGSRVYEKRQIFGRTNYLYRAGLSTGTWAYMLTPLSARKILKKIFPISYPIDITITVPDKQFSTDHPYDRRFENALKKLVVYTGKEYDNGRYGIINELSTYAWKESTSSATV